jgi:Domain of unknown function (DUF4389)
MTDLPQGTASPLGATGGPGATPDEILVAFAEPAPQNRLTVLVRIILAIPHLVVLYALSVAAEVVLIICWFAALFLGRLPEGLGDFLAGYLRWLARVQAYLLLLTDQYPPFALGEVDYPVQILLRPGPLNRLAVFFRIILAIPATLLATLVTLGMETIVLFVTWLIVLITGRMPRSLYEAFAAGLRYYLRHTGYLFLLTGTYPWGLFGDQPEAMTGWPGMVPPTGPGQAGDQPAAGYQPPAGYGPPGGEPPAGYGQPAPGYGQPGGEPPAGYSAPAPAYPGPGYGLAGASDAGPAGYGQPARPTRWLGGGQPWRLVLSSGAKGLVGMFLALGALVFVLYAVLIGVAISSSTTVSKAAAELSVKTAYDSLGRTVTSFDSKVTACSGRLSCVNRVDAQMSRAFATFGSQLHGIAMPTAASSAASATLQSDASQIATDFQQLSTASSASQYQQTVASTGLEGRLNQFDADYRSLNQTLGVT